MVNFCFCSAPVVNTLKHTSRTPDKDDILPVTRWKTYPKRCPFLSFPCGMILYIYIYTRYYTIIYMYVQFYFVYHAIWLHHITVAFCAMCFVMFCLSSFKKVSPGQFRVFKWTTGCRWASYFFWRVEQNQSRKLWTKLLWNKYMQSWPQNESSVLHAMP